MKTATCNRCGTKGLQWRNTNPDHPKQGRWYFVVYGTEPEERHDCRNTGPVEKPRQEPPEGAPAPKAPVPSENGGTDAEAVIETLRRLLADKDSAAVSPVDMDAIRGMVESVVSERLPAPIVIQLPDGTDHQIESAHERIPDLIQFMALRFNVLMVGPAGSGKSTAARQAANTCGLPYYEKTMGPATSEWDLTGYRSPDGVYVPGALREPYEHGGVLFLDELDNSNAETLTTLNGALANGHCQFPDGMVYRHADFVCVAAGNTYGRGADRLYVGRQQLDAATLDRFWVIDWNYDEAAELQWAGTDQEDWTRYVQRARRVAADLRLRVVISPRASIQGAEALRAGVKVAKVEDARLWAGMSPQDRDRITAGMGGGD